MTGKQAFRTAASLLNIFSIIMETDATAIAARVSRSRADSSDIVINEQTLLNAYDTIKERVRMFRA
jgi:hypothetical protein